MTDKELLIKACKFIDETLGDCPLSMYDVMPWKDCDTKCGKLMDKKETYKCWMGAFKKGLI